MKIISELLSKVSLSAIVAVLASIFSYRASSQKHERIKSKEEADEYKEIIDDIETSRNIDKTIGGLPPGDVDDRLRAKGWFRKE